MHSHRKSPTRIGRTISIPGLDELDSELGELARRANAARIAARDKRDELDQLARQLNRARTADAEAAAAAIEAGAPVPAPTEVELRQKVDDTTRELDGLATHSRQLADQLAAEIRGTAGQEWATQLDARLDTAAATISEAFSAVRSAIEEIRDASTARRTLTRVFAHPDRPISTPHVLALTADLGGGLRREIDDLLAGVERAVVEAIRPLDDEPQQSASVNFDDLAHAEPEHVA